MRLSIRAATAADIPVITAIYDHAVRHGTASFELEPPDAPEMVRRQKALLDGGFPYLVAEADGSLTGYAYAGAYRPRPAYRWSVEDSVYIAPTMHRRGIGAALLGALIAEAEQRGFRQNRGDRGFGGADAVDRVAPRLGLSPDRRGRERRLQVRTLARHGADAAGAGGGGRRSRPNDARSLH